MSTKNPHCEGEHCTHNNGEVRKLPYCTDGYLHLCYACYLHEMKFRQQTQVDPLVYWESLKIIWPFDLPPMTTAQLESYKKIVASNGEDSIRQVSPMFWDNCIMVKVQYPSGGGIWLGIETDGYTHS